MNFSIREVDNMERKVIDKLAKDVLFCIWKGLVMELVF